MAGSVNKVILIGNLGADPGNPPHPGRPAGGQSACGDLQFVEGQSHRRAQGKDRVAPGRHLQRESVPDRRAISQERLEGLHRRRSCKRANGRINPARTATRPRWCLQGFRGELTLLDRSGAGSSGGGGDFGGDEAGGEFGSPGPSRKLAAAGAGSARFARRHGRRDSVLSVIPGRAQREPGLHKHSRCGHG